jgi:hypothetical protein
MPKATTVRFSDEIYARLDQASSRTGMPVNSIVVAACLEWMERHTPSEAARLSPLAPPPRWSTIRRAVELAVAKGRPSPVYPFERFTAAAQNLLLAAQRKAKDGGFSYIGTEHVLLACFAEKASHSAQILATVGVTEKAVRPALEKLLRGKKPPAGPDIVPTTRVKAVIERAFKLCSATGDPRVSTGHVLLALSVDGEGIAARVLTDMGATVERIEEALESLTEPES